MSAAELMAAWKDKRGTKEGGWYYLKAGDEVRDTDQFMGSGCNGKWWDVDQLGTSGFELQPGFFGTYRRKVTHV